MQLDKLFMMSAAAMALLLHAPPVAADNLPAFPGAEGFGMYVTGGRGGAVYHVTKLDDDGSEGTFRWACNRPGVRTIVFDVNGTIFLKSALQLKNGNVTIAGQTAPGDGICIADYPFTINSDNVILRFLRFRCGNREVEHHEGDGLGAMDRRNIIVDHCSVSWSIDECLSVYGSKNLTVQWCIASQSLKNSGHSKGAHGYGGNWGGSGASYHHNLLADHDSRTPRLGPRPGTQTDERMDMRNNVIYNWGGNGCYGGEGMNVNIVNNYYKPGATTRKRSAAIQHRIAAPGIRTVDYCLDKALLASRYNSAAGTKYTKDDVKGSGDGAKCYVTVGGTKYEMNMSSAIPTITVGDKTVNVPWNDWGKMLHVWGKYYVDGNYNPESADMNRDNFKYGVSDQIDKSGNDATYPGDDAIRLLVPMTFEMVTTHTAEEAYERVLNYAGASLRRDALDKVIVSDTRNGECTYTGSGCTGGIINSQDDLKPADASDDWSPWPALVADASMDVTDTDGDGMPDWWEDSNGLNKNDASDGKAVASDGYTNLEHYINGLVQDIMTRENEGGRQISGNQTYDSAAGISVIEDKRSFAVGDAKVYNLQGMLVSSPVAGRIYIQNGKKLVW